MRTLQTTKRYLNFYINDINLSRSLSSVVVAAAAIRVLFNEKLDVA